jgi:hypothetical protein
MISITGKEQSAVSFPMKMTIDLFKQCRGIAGNPLEVARHELQSVEGPIILDRRPFSDPDLLSLGALHGLANLSHLRCFPDLVNGSTRQEKPGDIVLPARNKVTEWRDRTRAKLNGPASQSHSEKGKIRLHEPKAFLMIAEERNMMAERERDKSFPPQ